MIISKASKEDLTAIKHLMATYGKMAIEAEHLNNKDIALQARAEDGSLVGFIWCGLMAKGSVGYIDKFCVDSNYTHHKVGYQLMLSLQAEAHKRKVKEVFGLICRDQYHDKSAFNALRGAMGAHPLPYTMVEVNVNHSVKSLEMARK